jgi:hypothetical protein
MPLSRNAATEAVEAAFPPPLRNLTAPLCPSWISQNASPPSPVMCGYTTAKTALAAIAASTAEPPARKMSTPALEASACGDVTIPRGASVTGRPVRMSIGMSLTDQMPGGRAKPPNACSTS